MTVFNDTYDTATPAGSDDPAEADDRMREIKAAVQERLNVNMYFPLTGTEVSDADAGEIRMLTIRTLSAAQVAALTASKAYLYRLVTDGELYFKDASNKTIKLTSGGKILSASLDSKDEDNMASNSASHTATQQSIKAYTAFSAYTTEDSESNAILKAHAYLAVTAGFVSVVGASAADGNSIEGYVGTTNDPAGAGNLIQQMEATRAAQSMSLSFEVAAGEYFEITSTIAAPTIRWKSRGTLSKPVDQD